MENEEKNMLAEKTMDIQQTTDHDRFVIRTDNRFNGISKAHYLELVDKIRQNNLLPLRPIIVNPQMEVLDGQHRLKAARFLEVPIYYVVKEDYKIEDMIDLNTSRQWHFADYLHFYAENRCPQYVKLREFLKKMNISMEVGRQLVVGQYKEAFIRFKKGNYQFPDEERESLLLEAVDICHTTMDMIKEYHRGGAAWLKSAKFGKPLFGLATNEFFDETRWIKQLRKMVNRTKPCATMKEYEDMLLDIYNYGFSEGKLEL